MEFLRAVCEPEKSVRWEPVQNSKLRYFNPFELFDHTGSYVFFFLSFCFFVSGFGFVALGSFVTHSAHIASCPGLKNSLMISAATTAAAPAANPKCPTKR